MSALDHIAAGVRAVGVFAACVLIPAQIVLGAGYVIARQFFHFQLTPLQELEWHFFFALVFLTLGAAYLADRHVRIDIARDRLSERARAIIEISGFFIAVVPFCLIVFIVGAEAAWGAWVTGEHSRAPLGLGKRWIIKSTIPIGALLLFLAGCVVTGRNLQVLTSRRSL